MLDYSDVLLVVNSSHTDRYLNMTLVVSCFDRSFCIPKSYFYFEAKNSPYTALSSLGISEWVNLCVTLFGNFNSCLASLSICLLLLSRYGFCLVKKGLSIFWNSIRNGVTVNSIFCLNLSFSDFFSLILLVIWNRPSFKLIGRHVRNGHFLNLFIYFYFFISFF